MTYTCLGNNEYEISLTIFRDCFYGNPNAWFDDPASIGVFNSSNELLFEVQIELMGNDTLDPVLSGECFVVPPDVCVHTTTYTTIVELPPLIGGYQLAYQRCCRNQTIVNIIDPLDSGATYGVTISEQALLECNSSPKFNSWPPLYICVNEPIIFDQSAFDIDGDSVVYKLCAPLLGATPDIPQPQPPNNPPYNPVNWQTPYGVDNMLNGLPGGQVLEIDSQTGLLTGIPNTIGQFVVGICVEEYREGVLIATTRRDFQYNVGLCGQAVSSFFAPEVQCESLTVEFDNLSEGADEFQWFFNDPTNPGATTFDENTTYTYPDTGLYTIMLVAEPGTICADTSFQDVYLQLNSLFPDFEYDVVECSDSLVIQVNDLSTDTLSTIVEWNWTLLPQGETSDLQNPEFTLFENGNYLLELEVVAENGCRQTTTVDINVELIQEGVVDTLSVCFGESVYLNNGFNITYEYEWSPPETLDDPMAPNPLATPLDTTTYTVEITAFDGLCQTTRQVTVLVPEQIILDLPADTATCAPEVWLSSNSNTGVSFEWATDSEFDNVFAETDSVLVTPFGENTYYVLVQDELGCRAIDSVTIDGQGINILLVANQVHCVGDIFTVVALNQDAADTLSFSWTPTDNIVVGGNMANPIFSIDESGEYTFFMEAENQFGCLLVDSISVAIVDPEQEISFDPVIQCSGYDVLFSSPDESAAFYVWDFGDPADPNTVGLGANPVHTYSGPGTYEVEVTFNPLVPCPDTLIQEIIIEEPEIIVDFDWEFVTCGDSVVIQFTDQSINNQSLFTDREWIFSTGTTSTLENPSLTIFESQLLEVTLVQNSSDGCQDSITQQIPIELIDEVVVDSLRACSDKLTALNNDFNPDYTYSWSPADVLDDPTSPNPFATLTTSTAFTVTITDASEQCEIIRELFVFVPPPIEYELPLDTVTCDEEFLLFVNSPQAVSYAWSQEPDFTIPFSTEPEVLVTPDGPTLYRIKLTDQYDCVVYDVIEVDGNAIDVVVQDGVTICQGDSTRISVLNFSDDELTYVWSPLEGILSGADTGTPIVSPSVSTNYNVSITSNLGCTLDTSIQVNIFNFTPPLDVSADPDTLYGPGQSQLSSTFDVFYNYNWSPANLLDFSDIPDPLATLEETTTFNLRIEDQNGCVNERSLTVVVFNPDCRDPFIFVPKGFTPDGDGQNDIFRVRGNTIEVMKLVIFNRWGEKVFESTDQNIGWDGTFQGKELSSDVFGYYLEVKCINGEEYFKKGNVTLLR